MTTPPVTLRHPTPGDHKAVRKFTAMAMHGRVDTTLMDNICAMLPELKEDMSTLDVKRVSTGEDLTYPCRASMRIADYHGQPVGMSYTVPPLTWITCESNVSKETLPLLSGALTELNLLAVLPKYQGRGIGGMLLADVEKRSADTGHTTLTITTFVAADPRLNPWYQKHGYVFAGPRQDWTLQYWAQKKSLAGMMYVKPHEYVGFKALAPQVTVTGGTGDATRMSKVVGVLD